MQHTHTCSDPLTHIGVVLTVSSSFHLQLVITLAAHHLKVETTPVSHISPVLSAAYPLFLPTRRPPSHTTCVSSFTLDFHCSPYFRATKHVFHFAALASFIYLSLSLFSLPLLKPSISHSIYRENFHICVQYGFFFLFFTSPGGHKSAAH